MEQSMQLLYTAQKDRPLDILENMEIYQLRIRDNNIIKKQLNTKSDTILTPLKLALCKTRKLKQPAHVHIVKNSLKRYYTRGNQSQPSDPMTKPNP